MKEFEDKNKLIEEKYNPAIKLMESDDVKDLEKAISLFNEILIDNEDFKDARKLIGKTREKLNYKILEKEFVEKRDKIRKRRSEIRKEYESLGVFSFARKKELTQEDENLQKELETLSKRFNKVTGN